MIGQAENCKQIRFPTEKSDESKNSLREGGEEKGRDRLQAYAAARSRTAKRPAKTIL
jgi:hypothetical protein